MKYCKKTKKAIKKSGEILDKKGANGGRGKGGRFNFFARNFMLSLAQPSKNSRPLK